MCQKGISGHRRFFFLRSKWDWQSVPDAPMGQTPRASKYRVEHAQVFKTQPEDFSVRNDGGKL